MHLVLVYHSHTLTIAHEKTFSSLSLSKRGYRSLIQKIKFEKPRVFNFTYTTTMEWKNQLYLNLTIFLVCLNVFKGDPTLLSRRRLFSLYYSLCGRKEQVGQV